MSVDNAISSSEYHGYTCHTFQIDGCEARLVSPRATLSDRPWIWRAMFWDAFPGVDIALLDRGFHLAYIEVGNTFGCPDALAHWDPFYRLLVDEHNLSPRPVLEGLSRGGLYIYRWASMNAEKVGCLYGDAPVCDFKSWPGGLGRGSGSEEDWAKLLTDYHFESESEALAFDGNPIDVLEPIALAGIPIIHVCGDSDEPVPMTENTDILRSRYIALGGDFVSIVKLACGHHPHGLQDPTLVVDFLLAHAGGSGITEATKQSAPKAGQLIKVAESYERSSETEQDEAEMKVREHTD